MLMPSEDRAARFELVLSRKQNSVKNLLVESCPRSLVTKASGAVMLWAPAAWALGSISLVALSFNLFTCLAVILASKKMLWARISQASTCALLSILLFISLVFLPAAGMVAGLKALPAAALAIGAGRLLISGSDEVASQQTGVMKALVSPPSMYIPPQLPTSRKPGV